jgi:hypothetical protein
VSVIYFCHIVDQSLNRVDCFFFLRDPFLTLFLSGGSNVVAANGRQFYISDLPSGVYSNFPLICGSMASIVDADDHAAVMQLVERERLVSQPMFIGLTDYRNGKGNFYFTDKAPTSFFFDAQNKPTSVWKAGEPSLPGSAWGEPDRNCVVLKDGIYQNWDCNRQAGGICSSGWRAPTPQPQPSATSSASPTPTQSVFPSHSNTRSFSSSISKPPTASTSRAASATRSPAPASSTITPGPWYTNSQVASDTNRRFYIHKSVKLSFNDAMKSCEAHGTALASVLSDGESEVVNSLCAPFHTCWFGLTKQSDPSGKYRFVDGSSTHYILNDVIAEWETGDPTGECVEEAADGYLIWATSQPAKCSKTQVFLCADLPVKVASSASFDSSSAYSSSSSSGFPINNALLGVGAVCLVAAVATAGFVGVKVWKRRRDPFNFQELPQPKNEALLPPLI